MALPGTAHTARISVQWLRDGVIMENDFYVRDVTDDMFADPDGFNTIVAAAVADNLLPTMFGDVALTTIVFEDVRTVPFGGLSSNVPTHPAGALSSTGNLPNSATIAVKKATGNLGRSGRGRWYWASLDPSILDTDNTVDPDFVDDIIAGLAAMQNDIETSAVPCEVGIVSYYHDGALRANGLFQQITSWSVADFVVDSQRKRLPGRGR